MDQDPTIAGSSAGSEPVDLASALLDGAAFGTIVVSPTRQILAFDAAAERFTGLSCAQTLGYPASSLPKDLESVINDALGTAQLVNTRSVQFPGSNGETKTLAVSAHVARDAAGAPLCVRLELQDDGRMHEIITHLEHLDRLANIGILTASVAHEIKNALVAVRTFVDLLRERNQNDELARLVAKEIGRIDTAVRQVLRDATREEFTLTPTSVHALLRDSMNLLRKEFEARSIRSELRLEAPADQINGDERQLRHALLNLLMNSMEAMTNSAGRIEISTSLSAVNGQRSLCVTFTDTGCGIPADHLPRLFNPFFTTKKDGTGLGLAIARRIIKQHHGDITVESKVNEGATFRVLLPLL